MTQAEALTILKTGANVFLTGEPGAGKTYTINQYVKWLRERGIEPAITASTGIAATHIGGMTIHAWSGIGVKKTLGDWDLEALLEREPLVKRVRMAQVLIIDEVSMLDANILTLVDQAVRTIKNSVRAFGGMQVIFVGDFFQLPPVSPRHPERQREDQESDPRHFVRGADAAFAFESAAWQRANPITCYLSEQHRQSDDEFLGLLAAVRSGSVEELHYEILQARALEPKGQVTELYPHNANVDTVNNAELSKLDGVERSYTMLSQGNKTLIEALKRGCLSPELLLVKVGASVMFTRNNFEQGYVNGTLGVVEAFTDAGLPVVRTRGGKRIEVDPAEWRVEDGKRVLAKISQVPLRLAWAMTVHKSQGMSLDAAAMDLSQSFEYGQGYVALSRVKTLDGLYLRGFNNRALEVHPQILNKDADFRAASTAASVAFANIAVDELKSMQDNFVKLAGGHEVLHSAKNKKEGGQEPEISKLDKLRQKHPNAYRPWSDADDERLQQLFEQGNTPSQLQKEFGRQRGSIHARLIKLGLIEADA